MRNTKLYAVVGLVLCMALLLPALSQAQRRQRPPEYNEYRKAMQIQDLEARIAELERVKAAYPNSQFKAAFDSAILDAKIGLCTDVKSILQLQKPRFETSKGMNLMVMYIYSSADIVEHRNLAKLNKKEVTKAVSEYAHKGLKLADDPEFVKSVPERQKQYISLYAPMLYISLAKAYLNEDHAGKAEKALDAFQEKNGMKDGEFYCVLGLTQERLGKTQEAFESYFTAAVDNHKDSLDKAKALYTKLNGRLEGFDKKMEEKQRELPYHPEPFEAPDDWKGKVVLAELFTGSECPPCVGADMGFDGLIEAVGPKYVAILEYHLPIPRPDPIMNHATKKRQDYYGVRSTPTTLFDGENKLGGGGPRAMSETKYKQYSGEIKSRLSADPGVKLHVDAARRGDIVHINFTADKVLPDADFNVVLVQKEEKYHGGNGLSFHKRVVREFVKAKAAKSGKLSINLKESEKAAEKHLADYEKAANFQFPEKHFKIDPNQLQVVFFVQDKSSKKVYNAVVSDVK